MELLAMLLSMFHRVLLRLPSLIRLFTGSSRLTNRGPEKTISDDLLVVSCITRIHRLIWCTWNQVPAQVDST